MILIFQTNSFRNKKFSITYVLDRRLYHMNKLSLIWKTKDLRNKILIVLGLLLLTRVLAHIPIAGIDVSGLKELFPAKPVF